MTEQATTRGATETQPMSDLTVNWSLVFSSVAIVLSISSFYFQWIRVRGPKVSVLNAGQEQRSVLRPYGGLPRSIQQDFPEYRETRPGHAIVTLVLANTGDRPAYARFLKVDAAFDSDNFQGELFVAHYSYVLVPALSVVNRTLLLRNLPELTEPARLTVRLQLETGGPSGRFIEHLTTASVNAEVGVLLRPSRFDLLPDSG
jgi:hypothetical protein